MMPPLEALQRLRERFDIPEDDPDLAEIQNVLSDIQNELSQPCGSNRRRNEIRTAQQEDLRFRELSGSPKVRGSSCSKLKASQDTTSPRPFEQPVESWKESPPKSTEPAGTGGLQRWLSGRLEALPKTLERKIEASPGLSDSKSESNLKSTQPAMGSKPDSNPMSISAQSSCGAKAEACVFFAPGAAAQLHGLKTQYLNGLSAIVIDGCPNPDGRLKVQLALPPWKTIAVKGSNLREPDAGSSASLLVQASKNAGLENEEAAAAAIKAEFRMTDAQQHAAEVIEGIAQAASAFSSTWAAEKLLSFMMIDEQVIQRKAYAKNGYGGTMEMLLSNSTLIDAQYLIALAEAKGVMPRWQELPDAAKMDMKHVWRLRFWDAGDELPVLVLSYCWYSEYHPDPKGEQLQRVLPILRIMVDKAKTYSEHCTVAVLQDYGSFPQWPRTREEHKRLNDGLARDLHSWYTHPSTIVLMLDMPASDAPEHTNRRAYNERGWCLTEKRLATLVKQDHAFWRLSAFKNATSYDELRTQMVAKRPVLVAPHQFASDMREDVQSRKLSFSVQADMEIVIELYRVGFIKAFQNVASRLWLDGRISYRRLGWADRHVPALTQAIDYIKQSFSGKLNIEFSANEFSAEACKELQRLEDPTCGIIFDSDGERSVLRPMDGLTRSAQSLS